ncbi:MAG: methyltransferase [Flavobacteriaceae bacterium]|jgi:tRNA1Val (adenine37-N6)-methyltransferase|nr:methyltransferase [Flavobacteriaceae bacterium]
MNDVFKFKKFSVKQSPNVFKVGTDGVLLGCLANLSQARFILDIGTGTGLLSFICAQRNTLAQITAIDSETEAFNLARENSENSPFSSNICVIHSDLHHFISDKKFDYIICNPPYFKASEQEHLKHPVARYQLKLNYSSLIKRSKSLLSENGRIGYILPFESEQELLSLSECSDLFPERILRIRGIKNGRIRRTFLELSHKKQDVLPEEFYLEERPRIRSERYKNLTSEFYL